MCGVLATGILLLTEKSTGRGAPNVVILWLFLLIFFPPEAHLPMYWLLLHYSALLLASLVIAWSVGAYSTKLHLVLLIVSLSSYIFAAVTFEHNVKPARSLNETNDPLLVSTTDNVFIFILDGFIGQWVANYFAEDSEAADSFQGFILFKNAISAAPSTPYALPMIFKGDYDAGFRESTIQTNLRQSFYDSIFDTFLDQNYVVTYYPAFARTSRNDVNSVMSNALDSSSSTSAIKATVDFFSIALERMWPNNQLGSIANLLDTTVLSYEPQHLNWEIVPIPPRIFDTTNFRQSIRTTQNLKVFSENLHAQTSRSRMYLMHAILPHSPAVYDAKGYRGKQTSYDENAKYAISLMNGFIKRLRLEGIYEESTVVFLSDHGWNGSLTRYELNQGSRYNSLLLIKKAGAKHDLTVKEDVIFAHEFRKAIEGATLDDMDLGSIGRPLPTTIQVLQYLGRSWPAYESKRYRLVTHTFEGDFTTMPPWRILED